MSTKIAIALLVLLLIFTCSAAAEEKKKDDEDKIPAWLKKVKFSGQVRVRFEAYNNYSPSYPRDITHSKTLERTRFMIEAKPAKNLGAVVQFQDSRVWGTEPSTAADTHNIDLHQAYFTYRFADDSPFSVKVGRQEISYGDQRLIGAFGWSNVGRSFDATKLTYKEGNFQVDGFLATTVETFSAAADAVFGGVYAIYSNKSIAKFEGYYLYKGDSRNIYTSELAAPVDSLKINTLGMRLSGKAPGSGFAYQGEMALQTGDYGADSHEAWAAHLRGSYNFGSDYNFTFVVEYNYASGDDDPTDGKHGTFDNLFPTNHSKYGIIDFIGWKNMQNIRFGVSFTPAKGHKFSVDFHRFLRATENDDVYRASGARLLMVPAGVSENEIGQEIDVIWNFKLGKALGINLGYAHFLAGKLFEASLASGAFIDDADFLYLQAVVNF